MRTRTSIDGHHVPTTGLGLIQVVEVSGPTLARPANEVEQVLVGKPEAILLRTGRNVRLRPNEIVPQNPATTLHRDREPCRHHQQLLLLSVVAHRRAPPDPARVTETLPPLGADARPTRKVGVADIDPDVSGGLQNRACSVEPLGQVSGVPVGRRFKAQHATVRSVPVVRRGDIKRLTLTTPRILNRPVVILLPCVHSLAPVRGARHDQVHRRIRELPDQIECIAAVDLRSSGCRRVCGPTTHATNNRFGVRHSSGLLPRRTGIARPARFEGGGAHQALGHLRLRP